MCVIICGEGPTIPDRDVLERGAIANPDGFGFALVFETRKDLRLHTRRTMSPVEAVEMLERKVDELGRRVVAWAWHARIATSGAVDLSGCHPHAIAGEPKTVLLHNGMLPVTPADHLSDTGTFARDVLPAMGGTRALLEPHVRDMMSDWATGSKLVFVSSDPALPPLAIVNESAGYWDGGFWFSNSSCEPRASWGYYGGKAEPLELNGGALECPWCYGLVDPGFDECEWCGVCVWCGNYSCHCETEPLETVDSGGWDDGAAF